MLFINDILDLKCIYKVINIARSRQVKLNKAIYMGYEVRILPRAKRTPSLNEVGLHRDWVNEDRLQRMREECTISEQHSLIKAITLNIL